MDSLVGISPDIALPHGPSKIYIDEFLWHSPEVGVVAAYTPTEEDILDHFNIFRAADQIESFGQATIFACNSFITCKKKNLTFNKVYKEFAFVFLSLSSMKSRSIITLGDTFITIGHIKFCKFKQMTVEGRLYKVLKGIQLKEYFKDFTDNRILNYELSPDFQLVAEFNDLTGKGVKIKKLFNKTD